MRYLRVPLIGVGTEPERSPIRPDIPDGLHWTGQPHTDGTYLIAVPDDSSITLSLTRIVILDAALDVECVRRALTPTDVRRWFVAGRAT